MGFWLDASDGTPVVPRIRGLDAAPARLLTGWYAPPPRERQVAAYRRPSLPGGISNELSAGDATGLRHEWKREAHPDLDDLKRRTAG
jgi:hypothetical protein